MKWTEFYKARGFREFTKSCLGMLENDQFNTAFKGVIKNH